MVLGLKSANIVIPCWQHKPGVEKVSASQKLLNPLVKEFCQSLLPWDAKPAQGSRINVDIDLPKLDPSRLGDVTMIKRGFFPRSHIKSSAIIGFDAMAGQVEVGGWKWEVRSLTSQS